MASTFTTNKHLELQGTGDNSGTWGSELNTAVFTLVDQCLGSTTSIALAASPVTLSTAQTQNLAISFTGVLTANVTVTIPAVGGFFIFLNSTTGNFTVTIASAGGGTSQILPRSYAAYFLTDGTNVYNVRQPLGIFVDVAAAASVDIGTVPNGLVNVTGSGATITNFGSTARTVQTLFYVKFNGVNTITNSASIVCPGSADITTATNDVYLVWFAGAGVYRIIGAFLASGQALVTPSSTFVSVPQTILSGPKDSSGNPSFFPTSSASLSLLSQGLTTTPLVVTCSGGYGANGLVNYIASISTNQTWTATASTTTYFGWNLQTSAVVNTTLRPLYQRGGSISTTSGQYTYDITAGQMYLGTGADTSTVRVVFLGQGVASGSAITSVVMYGYLNSFGTSVSGSALSLFAQGYGLWGSSPTITAGNNLASVSYDSVTAGMVFTFTIACVNANYHVDVVSEGNPAVGNTGVTLYNKTTTGFSVKGANSSGQLSPRAGDSWSMMVYQRL